MFGAGLTGLGSHFAEMAVNTDGQWQVNEAIFTAMPPLVQPKIVVSMHPSIQAVADRFTR